VIEKEKNLLLTKKMSKAKTIELPLTNTEITHVLHALKIISMIKKHDKLTTQRGFFIDQGDDSWQAVRRWFNNENRFKNIDMVSSTLNTAFDICFELLKIRTQLNNKNTVHMLKNTQTLKRLTAEIKKAQQGLLNLTCTYQNDSHTVSRLILLDENIQDQLQQIQCGFNMEQNTQGQ
jgi:hypothetical protein